jgi:acylphosphatase
MASVGTPVSRETMDETQVRYRVAGRVQGVGFRWWTQRQGQRLGLRGTVRNLPDGAVEVTASGPSDRVSQLEQLLRRGPAGAQVDTVETLPNAPDAIPAGFEIRR